MSLIGKLDEFDASEDNWLEYWDLVEQFFLANKIEENKARTATFIKAIGKKTYSLLVSLTAPEKPASFKVEDLNKILSDHFAPRYIVIAERYRFYKRIQMEGETLTEYIAELRKLALYCDFKEFLDQALRDKFVCGLRDAGIRKKLLPEKNSD